MVACMLLEDRVGPLVVRTVAALLALEDRIVLAERGENLAAAHILAVAVRMVAHMVAAHIRVDPVLVARMVLVGRRVLVAHRVLVGYKVPVDHRAVDRTELPVRIASVAHMVPVAHTVPVVLAVSWVLALSEAPGH